MAVKNGEFVREYGTSHQGELGKALPTIIDVVRGGHLEAVPRLMIFPWRQLAPPGRGQRQVGANCLVNLIVEISHPARERAPSVDSIPNPFLY
jgi:hypothetical protein